MNKLAKLLVLLVLGAGSLPSYGNNGMITEMELMAIPSWCKSAFQNSGYSGKIAPSRSRSASNAGQSAASKSGLQIPGGHHFCAGLVELNRAKRGRGNYANAINEINYSYSSMGGGHPHLSFVASYLGKALYLSGKKKEASEVWLDAIAAQPSRRESYLALADVLMKEGQHEKALEVLLKYEEQKDSEAPDAEQFLAQAYFNLKQNDKALVHAENAHRMGYPFSGLLKKLRRTKENK